METPAPLDSRVPPLADGACQVWWAHLSLAREALLAVLDVSERERWSRLRVAEGRARYLLARSVARLVAGAHAGLAPPHLRFDTTCRRCGCDRGKPRLANAPDLELSISHAGDWAVVAVTRAVPVGVDVEEATLRGDRIPYRALSGPERALVEALPAEQRAAAFVRYWTRKEALLKATGDGMAVPPARVTVSAPDAEPALVAWDSERPLPATPSLADLASEPGYLASVAFLGPALAPWRLDAGPLLASASDGG